MNIEEQSRFVALLRQSQDQIGKLRKRVGEVFRNRSLTQEVVTHDGKLSQTSSSDLQPEIAHVLRLCAIDKVHFQNAVLAKLVERQGAISLKTGGIES
jgi:hypothetical protein